MGTEKTESLLYRTPGFGAFPYKLRVNFTLLII
jgi:hypothetical protein